MTRRLSHLLATLALGAAAWSGCGDHEGGKAAPYREEIYNEARRQVDQGKRAFKERTAEVERSAKKVQAEGTASARERR